jgi:hypothetical protein
VRAGGREGYIAVFHFPIQVRPKSLIAEKSQTVRNAAGEVWKNQKGENAL